MVKFIGDWLRLTVLAGYRTYVGAIGLLGLAIYLLSVGYYDQAWAALMAALVAVGLREHKPTDPPLSPLPPPPPPPPSSPSA